MAHDPFNNADDAQLWTAFKHGDELAYASIYRRYFHVLYNYGRHLTKNESLVEDCIQDLFIYLLKNRATLTDVQSIKYYLFKALRRRIHNGLLQLGKSDYGVSTEEYDFEIVPSHEHNLIADQSETARQERLRLIINQLPKRQKEVLFLLFYNDMTHKEVASILSLEIKTVYNLVYNALVALKKHADKISLLLAAMLVHGQ